MTTRSASSLTRLSMVLAVFSVCLTATVHLLAQTAPVRSGATAEGGFIAGRVKNKATNLYLPNARVQVEGTNISTLTEQDGSFLLATPAGERALLISYSGLTTARITVPLVAGQTVTTEIDLSSDIYTMESFTVTGLREENSLALQAQRYASNPKTVVATTAYGNASANPGDLLQRVSGVSVDFIAGEATSVYIRGMGADFSTLLVDGQTMASGSSISRAYQIQQWGTANLSQVELVKAPTPDQDANAIAGYINLVSKRAFDKPGRRLSISAGTDWTDRQFGNTSFKNRPGLDNFSLSYSDVFNAFGKKKNLGVTVDVARLTSTVFQEEIGTVSFNLAAAYLEPLSANPLPRLFGAGDYKSPNKQLNFGVGVEYKLDENSYVFAKFYHNKRTQSQEAFRMYFGKTNAIRTDFSADSTTAFATLLPNNNNTATNQAFTSTLQFYNFGINAGSEHKLFNKSATLSVRANYSFAHNENEIFSNVTGVARGFGLTFDRRNGDASQPVVAQVGGPDLANPASYLVTTAFNTYPLRPDKLYGFRADLTKNFNTAVPTYIKVGAKYNYSPRSTTSPIDYYTFVGPDGVPSSGDESMALFATSQRTLTRGQYGPRPFMAAPFTGGPQDPYSAFKSQWVQTAADVYNQYTGSLGSNTKLSEAISAAYASGHIDLGKVRILSGLRVENTKVEGTAWIRNTTATWGGNSVGGLSLDPTVKAANLDRAKRSFVELRDRKSEYLNVFPSVHFIYEPIEGLLARASYNKSISRPPVGNITPTMTENQENKTLSVGNPDLKPYHSDNFELSIEKYYEPVGRLSASVFLKEIKNYFRAFATTLGPDGLDGNTFYAGYTLSKSVNTGDARIRGFELNYQQEFTFLPGALSGLGAFANYTYTSTFGNFGTLTTTTKLPSLTPRTANAGLSYVKHGWAVRAMYNWRSKTYIGVGDNTDFFQRDRKFIDLKVQYRINRAYDVYVDVANLTNEPNSALISNAGLQWTYLRPGRIFKAGVNARF